MSTEKDTMDTPQHPWPLDLATLRRRPDVEDPTLQAHDATDELLLEAALAHAGEHGLTGADVAVLGERHGALTLGLASAGLRGMRVAQDRLAHERALAANAADAGLEGTWEQREDAGDATAGARLILWQLPRSVEEVRGVVGRLGGVAPDATLIAGGRVKHLSRGMNEPLSGFGPLTPQLASRKSRLLIARREPAQSLSPVAPERATREVAGASLHLSGAPGSFGGAALDPGTRLMLETLRAQPELSPAPGASVLDLGCGNGTIALWAALTWPDARVHATDDSRAAVLSTLASALASGVAERVEVARADGADHLPDASVDLVLLNPPFHQGGTVHTGIATKLMRSAARVLRPGGVLVCVWNSHLRYRPRLERLVGPTTQLARDRTFTITASTRRG